MKKLAVNSLKLVALSLTILLMNFSCEDHQAPEVLPVLKTLPITGTRETPPPLDTRYIFNFFLNVEEKGNVAVSEYGIVYTDYTAGELEFPENINKQPTISDAAVIPFTEEFGNGEKSRNVCCYTRQLRTDVFQRAYAKLADGRVIYGDVVWTVAGKVTPL